ncbi:unnamed protein product [Agarophyton chilense]|eukprot:gb/GEZJ01004315.1/.p1 GENE.gb/GEZJ01004315.1/~~gb/GEZJ01004315.1/.p1  ORF type:complete len:695 (-),score=88.80 gb/GEZJ01004315.1/:408-2492(-)
MARSSPPSSDSPRRPRFFAAGLASLMSRTPYSNSVDAATLRSTTSSTSDYNDIPPRITESDAPKPHSTSSSAKGEDVQMRNRVNVLLNEQALEHTSPHHSFRDKPLHAHSATSHPFLSFRPAWDMFMLVLLLYVSTVSVFVYSFLGVTGVDSVWFWLERLLDIFFTVDIVLSFFFPPYDQGGHLLLNANPRQARKQYLKTWFIPDVLSAFPWDVIALVIVGTHSNQNLFQFPRFLRVLRFLKFIRLFRFLRLSTVFRFFEVTFRLKYGHVRLASLYFTVIFISHWFACAFFYFGSLGLDTPWTAEDYVPADLYGKYMTALYFSVYTITTIGYGDVTPENTVERTYTTVIMFLGAACFAYIISQVSNISVELNNSSERFRQTMDSLTDLQQARDLPQELVTPIRQYFHRANRSPELECERDLLDRMTREHRLQVLKYVYSTRLSKSKLFENIPAIALDNVYDKVREKFFLSGQSLYRHGDSPKSFFILVDGQVRIEEQGEQPIIIDKPGEMFGDSDLLFYQKRQGKAVCVDFTTVICVPREAVMEVLQEHEMELKRLRDQEALILWERATKNVKQQIQYVRFARTLRCSAEEYMRSKGAQIEKSNSDTSTRAILSDLRNKSKGTQASAGRDAGEQDKGPERSMDGVGEQGREFSSIAELKAELQKKVKHIKQLERQLESVKRHFSEAMNVLKTER